MTATRGREPADPPRPACRWSPPGNFLAADARLRRRRRRRRAGRRQAPGVRLRGGRGSPRPARPPRRRHAPPAPTRATRWRCCAWRTSTALPGTSTAGRDPWRFVDPPPPPPATAAAARADRRGAEAERRGGAQACRGGRAAGGDRGGEAQAAASSICSTWAVSARPEKKIAVFSNGKAIVQQAGR